MSIKRKSISVILFASSLALFASISFAKVDKEPEPKHYDFRGAGQQMKRIYYGELQETIYCGCRYIDKQHVDFSTCNFEPRNNPKRTSTKRAERIEWEHIVTAHNMGHFLPCWRDGGRKNCTANDPQFGIMEGDLHNLYPAIGEVNGDRSNFMFSQWTNTPTPMYGGCNTLVDFEQKKIQPREEARGIVARVHFYMEKTYNIKLSDQDRRLFTAWDKMYPVTKLECIRDERIFKVQGDHNPFVYDKCKEAGLIP